MSESPPAQHPGRPRGAPRGGGLPPDAEVQQRGVAFFDLSRLSEWSSSAEDEGVAAFFQAFYRLAAERLRPAGARVVKFMGDAGLAVFPKESAEGAIFALADFARDAREMAREFGLDTWLNVSVHVGPVLVGSFGPPGDERFDVIGKTVNIAARLGRRGLTLSTQAYRTLSPEGRKRFDKIERPVTYQYRF
jgi:class 3 adenylate cyclase